MLLYMSLAGPQVPYGDYHQLIYFDFASVSDDLWGRSVTIGVSASGFCHGRSVAGPDAGPLRPPQAGRMSF